MAHRNGNGSTSSLKINTRSHLRAVHLQKESKLSSSLWKIITFNLFPFLFHLCNAELRKIIVILTFHICVPLIMRISNEKEGKIGRYWCSSLEVVVPSFQNTDLLNWVLVFAQRVWHIGTSYWGGQGKNCKERGISEWLKQKLKTEKHTDMQNWNVTEVIHIATLSKIISF